jgi:arginyl-tRNA synthetase
MTPAAWQAEMSARARGGARYGRGDDGAGRRTLVEFVSANPTGPLHVGHGRHAAFGATVANLLEADGWRVHREYYVNDAGRQMDILAASVWLRYLELCGESLPFPANGYRGDYVRPVAARLTRTHGECPAAPGLGREARPAEGRTGGRRQGPVHRRRDRAREGAPRRRVPRGVRRRAHRHPRGHPRRSRRVRRALRPLVFEQDLGDGKDGGPIDRALQRLRANGRVFEQDGATWFRATEFRRREGPRRRRANGQKTYFASDIAYHLDKRERGFSCSSRSSAPTTTATSRACARALRRWASRPSRCRCRWSSSSRSSRRREGADGQARGPVRDAQDLRTEVGNDRRASST